MLISPEALRRVVTSMCMAAGSQAPEAAQVAANLVEANLCGHDSHGVGMLPRYIHSALDGRLQVNRHARIVSESGAVLVVDGCRGYGQVVAREATELAIARVPRQGVCVMALRNAHHIGRVGAWAALCSAAGYVSMHYVNVVGHAPIVAPFGGTDARLATNPFCAALPDLGDGPVILDMATSKIALGKARVAMHKGEPVPPEALIDAQGRPTRDPNVMYQSPQGALLPFGLHKGYGLAVICELLAGALSGGGTAQPAHVRDNSAVNNMLSIVLDPAAFGDPAAFHAEARALMAYVTASPPAEGVARVLLPGDPERICRAQRLREGIPVDDNTWAGLVQVGAEVGVDVDALARGAAQGTRAR
ncbi:MAG: malate/lactate/ureidoglycolate dehydrogenase [Candidatus Lambdaproteobacteria bacterium]|nr:malate/lactate/ureidoglycolate dehydrogenase [Candidatus Lambdaproteobacteria bacterium]